MVIRIISFNKCGYLSIQAEIRKNVEGIHLDFVNFVFGNLRFIGGINNVGCNDENED